MSDKISVHVKDLSGWRGHASLYRLSPPMVVEDVDMGELECSYRGGLDHDVALRNAGYEPISGAVVVGVERKAIEP